MMGFLQKITRTSVDVQGTPSWFSRDWLWGLILILSVICGLYAGLAGGIYMG